MTERRYSKETIENIIRCTNISAQDLIRQLLAEVEEKEEENKTIALNAAHIAANQAIYLKELLDENKSFQSQLKALQTELANQCAQRYETACELERVVKEREVLGEALTWCRDNVMIATCAEFVTHINQALSGAGKE